jgi:tetratricopeptide (TPR) repeat protein
MRKVSIALALTLAAAPCWAQSRVEDAGKCASNDSDAKIAGCTSLILSGRDNAADLSIVYFNRGIAFSRKKRYDEAIADYTRSLALKPDPQTYADRGWAYQQKGLRDEAISDYTNTIALDPDGVEPLAIASYYDRASLYENKGLYERAIADLTEVIALAPAYLGGAYHARGLEYAHLRAYDHAIADFTGALEFNPSYADAYFDRGNAFLKKGLRDRAIADYTRAIGLKPDLPGPTTTAPGRITRRARTPRACPTPRRPSHWPRRPLPSSKPAPKSTRGWGGAPMPSPIIARHWLSTPMANLRRTG